MLDWMKPKRRGAKARAVSFCFYVYYSLGYFLLLQGLHVTDFHPSSYALATQETSFKKDQAEPRRVARSLHSLASLSTDDKKDLLNIAWIATPSLSRSIPMLLLIHRL